jgi:hypothetical protein
MPGLFDLMEISERRTLFQRVIEEFTGLGRGPTDLRKDHWRKRPFQKSHAQVIDETAEAPMSTALLWRTR